MMARMGQQMDRLQSMSDRIDKLLADVNAGHGSMGKLVNDPIAATGERACPPRSRR